MFLPFLKHKRWPRIAKPMEEKSYGLDSSEQMEEFCIDELMEAVANKDVESFRNALEALVMNCFEEEEEDDAA